MLIAYGKKYTLSMDLSVFSFLLYGYCTVGNSSIDFSLSSDPKARVTSIFLSFQESLHRLEKDKQC